ncbi:perilipin-1 [Elgaria multicarinata webbii]|uniref:perilipin-1 n=1 Tax=Elgaria multicarinata webbii TaxID=159646 RepID=UPI002FCD45EF
MITAKSKEAMQNGRLKENNALQRVLHIPVVNSACNTLQKTYTTTKEAHPLMALVCGAYERCVQRVTSLAAWSVNPVVQKLEPQVAAANVLACQGLDRLEQRIPALHQPVEKVTSDLKDSVLTHIQSALHSVMDTLDKVFGLSAKGYEQSESIVKDTKEFASSRRVIQTVKAGGDATIGKLEKAKHPKAEHKSAHEPPGLCVSNEVSQTSTLGRIKTLATGLSWHAYKQTVQTIQHTRDKGQELAMWIPGLGGLASQSAAKALQVISGVLNTATGWLSSRQGKVPEKEEEAKKEEDGQRSKTAEKAEIGNLLASLARRLHTASLAAISSMLNVPFTAWNTAGQLLHISPRKAASEAAGILGMLPVTLCSLLGTIFRYVPLPKVQEKQEQTASRTGVHSESCQELEGPQSIATHPKESGGIFPLQGERRSSRGHFPLPFLNLDEPLLPQQAPYPSRGPAFDAEYTGPRTSAFSPYKDGVGTRRRSEGLFRPSPEVTYTRAHYGGLYSTTFKKD